MKLFYLINLDIEEIYEKFIEIMLDYSDYFSLIYFQYKPGEKMKKSSRLIKDSLLKYKYISKNVKEWPGTISLDREHIYGFTLYHSNDSVNQILRSVKSVYNWDYPKYPMDLCFYKDGCCIFDSVAHEEIARLYSNDNNLIELLSEIGVIDGDPEVDYTIIDDGKLFVLNMGKNEKDIFRKEHSLS